MTSNSALHHWSGDAATASTLRLWLLDHVCPFWAKRMIDPAGGFFEALDLASEPLPSARRSILNQARLTYVFSHAYILGKDPAMLSAASHGFSFLQRCFRKGEGWPHGIGVDGAAFAAGPEPDSDAKRDAYDHAFVLFACAWYYRAAGDAGALTLAHATYDFMQRRMADPAHGGFYEDISAQRMSMTLPRRQNPHMHLLEAMQALHASTGDDVWRTRAGQLLDLFERHFFDADSGSLAEYFDADWRIVDGAPGRLREPGHQFEWVWLLHEAARHSPQRNTAAYAEQLFSFGSRFGIDRQEPLAGMVFDGVEPDGKIVAASKLLWPQTEYIKACLSRWEWLDDRAALDEALAHIERMRRYFFLPDQANWRNQLSRDGQPLTDATPARVLYHLFLAIAEAIRVLETKPAM